MHNVIPHASGQVESVHSACGKAIESYLAENNNQFDPVLFKLFSVTRSTEKMNKSTTVRVFRHLGLKDDHLLLVSQMRRHIKKHLAACCKGKKSTEAGSFDNIQDMLKAWR